MKYPDGSMIQFGDLIWWNEGHCVGYVQVIAESKEEHVGWGLEQPHVFVSNVHPFNPTIQSGVAYPESCLAEEGIGLLTPEERVQLDEAAAQAHQLVGADLKYSTYHVLTQVLDGKLTGLVFRYLKEDGTELERVTVPVIPESNA